MRIISPSILAADFGQLDRDVEMINQSEAQWVHFDVMDGVFVPNISFGFPILEAVRKKTEKILDIHLMITSPERYIERFAKAGADIITIHLEATQDAEKAIEMIHACGKKAGISIKPGTDPNLVMHLLEKLDLILVMSVEPGFGGQKFIPESLEKVRRIREEIDRRGIGCLIEIDGGVSSENSAQAFSSGVDAIVAGSAVFKAEDPKQEIITMLEKR